MFKTTRKIYNVSKLLRDMLHNTGMKEHADTLVGPRTQGSTTSFGLDHLSLNTQLNQLEMDDVAEGVLIPGCVYLYTNQAKDLLGKLGATLPEDLAEGTIILERQGKHGPEKFLNVSPDDVDLPSTDDVTIILGPAPKEGVEAGWPSERMIIWTWHPGLPMDQDKAIKLHNGGGEALDIVRKVDVDDDVEDDSSDPEVEAPAETSSLSDGQVAAGIMGCGLLAGLLWEFAKSAMQG